MNIVVTLWKHGLDRYPSVIVLMLTFAIEQVIIQKQIMICVINNL